MVKKYADIVVDLRRLDKMQISSLLQHPTIGTPQDPLNQTLLHFLADAGIVEIVNHPLVDKLRSIFNETPLHYLALKKKMEVLGHCSVDKVQDNGGGTPLHNLASHKHLAAKKISMLLKHPSIGRVRDNHGRTPLHLLAENGFVDLSYLKEHYPWFPFKGYKEVTLKLLDEILNTSGGEKFILKIE